MKPQNQALVCTELYILSDSVIYRNVLYYCVAMGSSILLRAISELPLITCDGICIYSTTSMCELTLGLYVL